MNITVKHKKPLAVLRLKQNMRGNIERGLTAGAILYERAMKIKLKSGSPLGVISGRLSGSPTHTPVQKDSIGAYIAVGTNLVYAPVHELGLRAGRGKGFPMPKRPTWGPVFAEKRPDIVFAVRRYMQRNLSGRN